MDLRDLGYKNQNQAHPYMNTLSRGTLLTRHTPHDAGQAEIIDFECSTSSLPINP